MICWQVELRVDLESTCFTQLQGIFLKKKFVFLVGQKTGMLHHGHNECKAKAGHAHGGGS
jgi:hypothetical protein